MSYWQGNNKAPGYSREVEAANNAVKAAQEHLQATLCAAYPRGCSVRVIHHRGTFNATVVGWDHAGARVVVTNDSTGRQSKWWAAHVEVVEGGAA